MKIRYLMSKSLGTYIFNILKMRFFWKSYNLLNDLFFWRKFTFLALIMIQTFHASVASNTNVIISILNITIFIF